MGNSVGISPMLICLLISVTKAVFPNTENAKEFKMQHATKDDEASPRGHLEPLGSHGPPTGKLDIVDNVPSPPEFYQRYVRPSKPVVLKGAARSLPAFQLWTDEYLRKANGALEVEVEEGKKEDRSLNVYVMTLKQFLDNYLDEDLYLVESLKPQLHGDFGLLRCLLCGGFTRLLQDTIMWLNSGGTKSVLHYDDVDNINCVLDGDKKVLLVDKNDAHHIDMDRAEGGYSNVDVDMVDMYKYPGLQDLPYYLVNLSRGDCLYLPARWPHHVRSGHSRSLAVNVWFARLQWFDEEDCHKRELPDFEPLHNYRFSSTNEPLRSEILAKAAGMNELNEEDLWNCYSSFLGSRNQSQKVFRFLDADGDGLVSWREMYAIDADTFVKLFPWLFKPKTNLEGQPPRPVDEL